MEELNPTNAFGELLLDLIDAQYGGDYDSGIAAIMEATGLAEEEVTAIINGDTIVEDESLLSGIVDAFPDADEDDLEVIVNVATGVDEADRDELLAEIEAGEGEDAAVAEEEMAGAAYAYNNYLNQASFAAGNAAQAAGYANARVQSLENKLANFEAANYLNGELRELHNLATRLVENGALPPSYRSMLIGNFADDGERVARFGQIASSNGVDLGTMLFATKYAMGLLSDAADFVEFRDYSVTDEDVAIANFQANLDTVVSADIDAIFNG